MISRGRERERGDREIDDRIVELMEERERERELKERSEKLQLIWLTSLVDLFHYGEKRLSLDLE